MRSTFLVAALVLTPVVAHAQPARPAPPAPFDARVEIGTLRGDLEALRAKLADLDASGSAESRRLLGLIEALDARVAAVDDAMTKQSIAELRRDLDALAEQVGSIAVAEHDGGFRLKAADGYALRIGGYMQGRWSGTHRDDVTPEWQAGGFALRRTRLVFDGDLGDRVSFRTMLELVSSPLTFDAWAEVKLGHGVALRAGRDKVPFTRSFLAGATTLTFTERPVVVDQFRWQRDLGVQLRGTHGRVEWSAGVGNGAVDGAVDRMPSVAARVAYAVAGKLIAPNPGDLKGTKDTAITIGVDGVIDAPTVPAAVGMIMVDPDPEKNGTPTRVKVQAASADVTLRRHGLELSVEGLVRRDDWRDALRTAPMLEDVVGGRTPVAMAALGELTYMVMPGRLLAGARVAAGDLPVLSMRQATTIPRGDDVVEMALTAMGLYQGRRAIDVSYTYLDFGDSVEQRIVIEGQVNL